MGDESSSSVDGSDKKRQREGEGEGDVAAAFQKSRKIYRSPPKSHRDNEGKLDRLLLMLGEMKKEMGEMRREQKEYVAEIIAVKKENEKLKKECESRKVESEEMKRELDGLKRVVGSLEREKRERNIVITGRSVEEESPRKLAEDIGKFLEEHLGVRTQVRAAYRLGQKVCLAQFDSLQEKERIMKNKHKLKDFSGERIYINNDLTLEEREMQKQIRGRAREEKSEGKLVRVGLGRITIDGREWKWNRGAGKLEAKN